jgi:hypothetical protein
MIVQVLRDPIIQVLSPLMHCLFDYCNLTYRTIIGLTISFTLIASLNCDAFIHLEIFGLKF